MDDLLLDAVLDDLVDVDLARTMHVRTPAGEKKYGLPIGSVIHAHEGETLVQAAKRLKTAIAVQGVSGPGTIVDEKMLRAIAHDPVKGDKFYTINKTDAKSYTVYTYDGDVWHYKTPITGSEKTASKTSMQSAISTWIAQGKGQLWALRSKDAPMPMHDWEMELMGAAPPKEALPTPTLQKTSMQQPNPKMPVAADLHTDFPSPALDADENWALHDVYGYAWGYKLLNPFLFHNEQKWDTNAHGYVDVTPEEKNTALKAILNLDSAFLKAKPLDHAVVVYRRSGDEILKGHPGEDLTGEVIENKGYTSTATSLTTHGYGYESKPVLWKIVLPEGTKALPGNDFENEVLLNRGAHFSVISDEKTDNGDRVLTVKYSPAGAATREYHPDPEQLSATGPKHAAPKTDGKTVEKAITHLKKDFLDAPEGTIYVTPKGTYTQTASGWLLKGGGNVPLDAGWMVTVDPFGSFQKPPSEPPPIEHLAPTLNPFPPNGHKPSTVEELAAAPIGTHITFGTGWGSEDEYVKNQSGLWVDANSLSHVTFNDTDFESGLSTGKVTFVQGDQPHTPLEVLNALPPASTVHTGATSWMKAETGDWWSTNGNHLTSSQLLLQMNPSEMEALTGAPPVKPLAQVLAESVDFLKQTGTAEDAPVGTKYVPPGQSDSSTYYVKTADNEWTMHPHPPPASTFAPTVPDSTLDQWKAFVKAHPDHYVNPVGPAPVPVSKPSNSDAIRVNGGYKTIPGQDDNPDFPVMDYDKVKHNVDPLPDGTSGQVTSYVGSWASQINNMLRHNSVTNSFDKDRVARMDRAFTPIHHAQTLFRSLSTDAVGIPHQHGGDSDVYDRLKALVGKTIVDKGYVSTSYDLDGSTVTGEPYFSLRIHAPAGTPAVFAQPLSGFDEEHEEILPRDLPLKINDVTWATSDYGATMFVLDVTALPEKIKHLAVKPPKAFKTLPKTVKATSSLNALPIGTEITRKNGPTEVWVKGKLGKWNAIGNNFGSNYNSEDLPYTTWLVKGPDTEKFGPGQHHYGPGSKATPDFVTQIEFQEAPIGTYFHSNGSGYDWKKVEMGPKGGKWQMADQPDAPPAAIAVVKIGGPGFLTYPDAEHLPTPGYIPKQEMIDAALGTVWHSPSGDWIKVGKPSLWKKKDPPFSVEEKGLPVNGLATAHYQGTLEKPHSAAPPEHEAGYLSIQEMNDAPVGTIWHAPTGDLMKHDDGLWWAEFADHGAPLDEALTGVKGTLSKPSTHPLLGKKPPNAVQSFSGLGANEKKAALHLAQEAKPKLIAEEPGARIYDANGLTEWEKQGGPGAGWEYLGGDIETIKWALDEQGKHKQIESANVALWVAAKNQKEGWSYTLKGKSGEQALTQKESAWADVIIDGTAIGGTVTDAQGVQWVKAAESTWRKYGTSTVISSSELKLLM